jgi:hypothetical protein
VQWLSFCDNLYIAGEASNIQYLGRHSNLKERLKTKTKKIKKTWLKTETKKTLKT